MGIQQQVVKELRLLIPKGQLVLELQKLLEVSRASIYKRLSGEISLNAEEIDKIISKYPISLGMAPHSGRDIVTVHIPPKPTGGDPIIHFLTPIRDQLRVLRPMDDALVTFLAVSFPVFYTFLYPEIALFKFYVYKNSVWKSSHAKIPPLAIASLARNKNYIKLFSEIREAYAEVASTEVWTQYYYQSTIDEIKFYLECNLFTEPEEANLLMEKLTLTIEKIAQMAQQGNKSAMSRFPNVSEGAPFNLYYNNSGHFGSTIVASSDKLNIVYLTYDQPNYLVSDDIVLVKDTLRWVNKVVKKSTPISELPPLDQVKYFNQIKEDINLEKVKIQELVEQQLNLDVDAEQAGEQEYK